MFLKTIYVLGISYNEYNCQWNRGTDIKISVVHDKSRKTSWHYYDGRLIISFTGYFCKIIIFSLNIYLKKILLRIYFGEK